MKKATLFVAVCAFVGLTALSASADETGPGQYYQSNHPSVTGVTQTMMQMGAKDRALTNAVNLASGAGRSRSDTGVINGDYQFGSSQTEQSWKQWRTVEDAGVVVGLTLGCISILYFIYIMISRPERISVSSDVPEDQNVLESA